MPERPLLILPNPGEPARRRKKGGGAGRFHRPDRERQLDRLAPRFELLQQALEAGRTRLQVAASGLVPEEVIVLETVGTVDSFIRAVEKVPGMEWLAEVANDDIPPDDDFFAMSKDGAPRRDKVLRGSVFMVFANQQALQQMRSLWDTWQSERDLPRGLKRWRVLFEQLHDVRLWGVRDRLRETGVLRDWRERVDFGHEVVPCEIELWYRKNPELRRIARDRVAELVGRLNGQVVTEVSIEEIAYHTLLVRLPVDQISPLVQNMGDELALAQCEQIQFFRASAQMAVVLSDESLQDDRGLLPREVASGAPVIALFDGLPLQAHRRLLGHLIVDDPDGFEQEYPAATRRHGTAMASLIVHGDLAAGEGALPRPLYIRPILRPDPRDWIGSRERVPEDTLVVDLLHRAVRRLFDGDGNESPVAQDVAVINLSIGISDRPFEQSMSPLARLLDWLAWRYKVLFVVSAGNYSQHIELSLQRTAGQLVFSELLQTELIRSIAADTRNRRILSPAEAVNALTVGAVHSDVSTDPRAGGWHDPYVDAGLPSPINAQGMGYRRGIKPDVLAPGGRIVVRKTLPLSDHVTLEVNKQSLAPGQLVAAPGRTPGDQGAAQHARGTSNATALVSRAAGLLYEVVQELRDDPGGNIIDTVPQSVWLKALIAHGADWGTARSVLDAILRDSSNSRQFTEYITRLIGYGTVDVNRVRECTAHRVTALSGGVLKKDQSLVHRFPLPSSISGKRGYRRLTISLAWLTPVNPRHQRWRRADLWFAPPHEALRVKRRQANWQAVQRGTLQHEILEGEDAAVFEDNKHLEIQVSCRADAGTLEEAIPYALITTLEVAEEIGVEIYDEVRVAVYSIPVRVATNA